MDNVGCLFIDINALINDNGNGFNTRDEFHQKSVLYLQRRLSVCFIGGVYKKAVYRIGINMILFLKDTIFNISKMKEMNEKGKTIFHINERFIRYAS